MQTRIATHHDAEQVVVLINESWCFFYADFVQAKTLANLKTPEALQEKCTRWQSILKSPTQCTYVLEEKETLVGVITGTIEQKEKKIIGEIKVLYLKPGFEIKGLGILLFNTLSQWFQSQQCTSFCAYVFEDNHLARSFYERMGGLYCESTPFEMDGHTYHDACYWFESEGG